MKPTIRLIANGSDISGNIAPRLVDLTYEDSTDETSDTLQFKIEDTRNEIAAPMQGATLELSLGYNGAVQRIGTFVVDEVEVDGPPNVISIQASATPFRSSKDGKNPLQNRKSRSFDEKTFREIAETVASESGLQVEMDDELGEKMVAHVDQINESDLNLLVRLARKYGAVVKPADGRLVIVKESGGKTAKGQAVSITLRPSLVSKWKVRRGGKASAYTKVRAEVHNFETGETEEVEIETKTKGMPTMPSAGASGQEVDTYYSDVLAYSSADDAKEAAKTKGERMGRASASFDLDMPGTLSVIAGAKVTLSGFHPAADGDFVAKVVRHKVSRSGWTTSVSGEAAVDSAE